ncbi:general stress protein [Sporosarcina thermotolerans]|uniref:General stress protein n=1 Tax=Sporosarcina thermotolerans TaxID=633404 RepID=A0AAW9AA73_9BACL|nr:general stress protein [Sporosarcina thermotolerans]MDW0116845.1 general stress protein [Sporosarcina thermotolerans]WHT48022.1 general stress protein [Sporosarcina thermotolerans]
MKEKKFVGMYHDDSELMAKIDQLKSQGFEGENIYVIAEDENDIRMFQGMKYGDVKTTPDSWFNRFIDFLTGEDHVRSMLQEVGVSEGDMENYYTEIKTGGKLLYVDQGEVNLFHTNYSRNSFGVSDIGSDPNLGANRISDFESNEFSSNNYSSGAFQDSNLHEGTDTNFGRVGGEATVNESRKKTDYE